MKLFKQALLSLLLVATMAIGPIAIVQTASATPQEELCKGTGGSWDATAKKCTGNDSGGIELDSFIKTLVNILLYVIGAVSVIMIVIGGFKYVLSGGDSSGVTSAKNTILYAVVGLAVSILGYSIVNFVIENIK